jgi:hypothetical protein
MVNDVQINVVADDNPLPFLILIDHPHALPALYGRVIVARVRSASQ